MIESLLALMCANIFCNQWQQSTICGSKWDDVEDARESDRYSGKAEGGVAAIWNRMNIAIQIPILLAMTYFYLVPTPQKTVMMTIASPPFPLIQKTLPLLYCPPSHPPCPFLPQPVSTQTPQPNNNGIVGVLEGSDICYDNRQDSINPLKRHSVVSATIRIITTTVLMLISLALAPR